MSSRLKERQVKWLQQILQFAKFFAWLYSTKAKRRSSIFSRAENVLCLSVCQSVKKFCPTITLEGFTPNRPKRFVVLLRPEIHLEFVIEKDRQSGTPPKKFQKVSVVILFSYDNFPVNPANHPLLNL